jgi:hypothetical protein
MTDETFCRERLRLVRELADKADPFIKNRLTNLASHYERRLTHYQEAYPAPSPLRMADRH